MAGCFERYQFLGGRRNTETWREPINRDGINQASKSVVFVASDGRRWSHVLRSDARIGTACQKQEVNFVIVNGGIVNKEFI